ncbi:acyl-CoA thioesterase [Streptococcus loxodontisalivarius]|uniref:Acyl-CoA thioester hydrolase n=1 Tax=Streptococcus loxodontisalivarius TaxID=1349415 RepID=A0ABS2PRZ6_9STRE|nr:acyl-CoA thioesterase [Streptococcus loxodontisalivarius]MBM7642701.1 acyl-CoA thioester hydrolase [Streptococcus loxodontisalivarius]
MTIIHKHYVQYYETDRMGISHHSNYVRWMEEARTHFLREIGWSYDKIEEAGIISPVTQISCDYKATTTFADEIEIAISVLSVKAARLSFSYVMIKQDGSQVCTAQSEHSFLDKEGRFVNLKKQAPDFFQKLKAMEESGEK